MTGTRGEELLKNFLTNLEADYGLKSHLAVGSACALAILDISNLDDLVVADTEKRIDLLHNWLKRRGVSMTERKTYAREIVIRIAKSAPVECTPATSHNAADGRPSPLNVHVVFGFLRMSPEYREVVTGECEEKFHFVLRELGPKKYARRVANAAYIAVVLQTAMLYLLNGAKSWIIGLLVGIPIYKKIFGGD